MELTQIKNLFESVNETKRLRKFFNEELSWGPGNCVYSYDENG
jgi:hypothetical protein